MKRFLALLAAALLAFTAAASAAELKKAEKTDVMLDTESTVAFSFTTHSGRLVSAEDTENKVRVITFVNLSADSSYFLADDLSNSQWAGGSAVDILAVDVTGKEAEALALYREGLDSAAVSLAVDSEGETAAAFAEAAGLDAESLTLPFTVILDREGSLRYAMEGYRKPDLLASYVEALTEGEAACTPENPLLFAYSWKDGVKLYWIADEAAGGYALWRSDKADGTYEQVYVTENYREAAYTDFHTVVGETYYYKLERTGQNGVSWSQPVQVLRESGTQ